eukprot:10054978-Alexandrium_andersonii.AAC.1
MGRRVHAGIEALRQKPPARQGRGSSLATVGSGLILGASMKLDITLAGSRPGHGGKAYKHGCSQNARTML